MDDYIFTGIMIQNSIVWHACIETSRKPLLVKVSTSDGVHLVLIHHDTNISVYGTYHQLPIPVYAVLLPQEMLQMLARALGTRLHQLQLLRGGRGRSRILVVDNMTTQEVFDKLQAAIAKGA